MQHGTKQEHYELVCSPTRSGGRVQRIGMGSTCLYFYSANQSWIGGWGGERGKGKGKHMISEGERERLTPHKGKGKGASITFESASLGKAMWTRLLIVDKAKTDYTKNKHTKQSLR